VRTITKNNKKGSSQDKDFDIYKVNQLVIRKKQLTQDDREDDPRRLQLTVKFSERDLIFLDEHIGHGKRSSFIRWLVRAYKQSLMKDGYNSRIFQLVRDEKNKEESQK
jgi:hypothetical protein